MLRCLIGWQRAVLQIDIPEVDIVRLEWIDRGWFQIQKVEEVRCVEIEVEEAFRPMVEGRNRVKFRQLLVDPFFLHRRDKKLANERGRSIAFPIIDLLLTLAMTKNLLQSITDKIATFIC